MAETCDLILTVSFQGEPDAIDLLNRWCAQHGDGQTFTQLDTDGRHGGHGITFLPGLWLLAGRRFPWSDLPAALPTFGWDRPDDVVLTIYNELTDAPVIVTAVDGVLIPT